MVRTTGIKNYILAKMVLFQEAFKPKTLLYALLRE